MTTSHGTPFRGSVRATEIRGGLLSLAAPLAVATTVVRTPFRAFPVRSSDRSPMMPLLAILVSAVVALGIVASNASAADSYVPGGTFSVGETPGPPFGPCGIKDLDTDAQENVYVICGGENGNGSTGAVIKKFDRDGNPVPFTGNAPWVSGNAILYNPDPRAEGNIRADTFGPTFGFRDTIKVNRGPGPTHGFIYVSHNPASAAGIVIFDPSGAWIGTLRTTGFTGGIATDGDGNVYSAQTRVNLYNSAWTLTKQFFASFGDFSGTYGSWRLAADSTGAVWGISGEGGAGGSGNVRKFEADQFRPPELESSFSFSKAPTGRLSPYVANPLRSFGSTAAILAGAIAVDEDTNDLFVFKRNTTATRGILQVSPGTDDEEAHQLGAPIGGSADFPTLSACCGLSIGENDNTIYAGAGANTVVKFTAGEPLPTIRAERPQLIDIGHTTATVHASLELAGGAPITDCEVRYGPTEAYSTGTAACTPDPAEAAPGSNFTEDTEVSASLTGLPIEDVIHYAFVAKSAAGEAYGVDRSFRTAAVLNLETGAVTDVTDGSATLNGSFNPDSMETSYHFEYGLAGDFTQKTAAVPPLNSGDNVDVSIPIEGLRPNGVYTYRLVAENELGATQGPGKTFRAAGPPVIDGVRAKDLTSTTADLEVRINPNGYPAKFRVEYGSTVEYGTVVPAPPTEFDAGDGKQADTFSVNLTGLSPSTHHFRVVTSNQWGSSASADTTFSFLPQACPNEHVRQQTKSTSLPDCRAYELVSPANMGGVQIYPGSALLSVGAFNTPEKTLAGRLWNLNTGGATSPSRFSYYGGLGSINGHNTPNIGLDNYVATRTDRGWTTAFPGLKGSDGGRTGRRDCSDALAVCVDHPVEALATPINAGHLFDSEGREIGVVPTNLDEVPDGEKFIGDQRLSPDGGHFVFSSVNVPFTDGGLVGAPGSAYDNNLGDRSMTLISRMPNGESIPSDSTNAQEFITFPPGGISRDGSRIMMQTVAANGMNHLYMRVEQAITYDIASGAGVSLVGMTEDGKSVVFTATDSLVPEDLDGSTDLYRWNEEGGTTSLSLLSVGNGHGDGDDCQTSWTTDCSIITVQTLRGDTNGYTPAQYASVTVPGIDSKIASANGAVYFFSPETLDGGAPENGKNLYLARDDQVQYVATLNSSATIDRLQISPDGLRAGFLTRAQLTDYDNAGFQQMYTFNAANGALHCASCNPSGEPPNYDVEASKNGPFMADDGRVFFTTSDRLVAGDVDTFSIPDVYEYVDGRPQLISSGISNDAKAPGGANFFVTETLGLEAVSGDGRDVFFSTTDTLVPQDDNGQFAKIYVARTNGGFEPDISPAPCVAADECHGGGVGPPAPIRIGTQSTMTGGNYARTQKKSKRKQRAKRRRAKAKRRARRAKRRARRARAKCLKRYVGKRGRARKCIRKARRGR